MVEIVTKLKSVANDGLPSRTAEVIAVSPLGQSADIGTLRLTIDAVPHSAYMVNYNFEIVWFNDKAQRSLLGFDALPPNNDGRNVFQLICNHDGRAAGYTELLRFHLALAKGRLSRAAFVRLCKDIPHDRMALLETLYAEVEPVTAQTILETPVTLVETDGTAQAYRAYAAFYREGILFVYVPEGLNVSPLLGFLARRDEVIRDLLRKRLPVLTPLAVLVADLQSSAKICSELPPEEYFELINQIWSAMGPIFRKYYGTHGKHVGDGMVYYFFPQPDTNYTFNALLCAQELKSEMRKISTAWQLRKNWLNELFLNTGLHEGEEWLGTFQSATNVEFAVLGDTINHAARLSDFSRHGAVWATKSLIGKLNAADRSRVRYGIKRRSAEGREVFIAASFSLPSGLVDLGNEKYEKLREIAVLPITEVVEIAPQPERAS